MKSNNPDSPPKDELDNLTETDFPLPTESLYNTPESRKSLRKSFRKSLRKSLFRENLKDSLSPKDNFRKSKGKSSNKYLPLTTDIKITIPVFGLTSENTLEISEELKNNLDLKIRTTHVNSFSKILKDLYIQIPPVSFSKILEQLYPKVSENKELNKESKESKESKELKELKELLELSCIDIRRNTDSAFRYFIDDKETFPSKDITEKLSNTSKIITKENVNMLYIYFKKLGFPEETVIFLMTHLCQRKFSGTDYFLFYYLKQITYKNEYIDLDAHEHKTCISWDSKKSELTLFKTSPIKDSANTEIEEKREKDSLNNEIEEKKNDESPLDFSSKITIFFPKEKRPIVTGVDITFTFKEFDGCYPLFPTIFHYHIKKLQNHLKNLQDPVKKRQDVPPEFKEYLKLKEELSSIIGPLPFLGSTKKLQEYIKKLQENIRKLKNQIEELQNHIEKLQDLPSECKEYVKANKELSFIEDTLLSHIKTALGLLTSLDLSYVTVQELSLNNTSSISTQKLSSKERRKSHGHLTSKKIVNDQQKLSSIKKTIDQLVFIYNFQQENFLLYINQTILQTQPFFEWLKKEDPIKYNESLFSEFENDNKLSESTEKNVLPVFKDKHIIDFLRYCKEKIRKIEEAHQAILSERGIIPSEKKVPEKIKIPPKPETTTLKKSSSFSLTGFIDTVSTFLSPRRTSNVSKDNSHSPRDLEPSSPVPIPNPVTPRSTK